MKQYLFTKNSNFNCPQLTKGKNLLTAKSRKKKIQTKTHLTSALIIALLAGFSVSITGCGASGSAFSRTKNASTAVETTAAAADMAPANGYALDSYAMKEETMSMKGGVPDAAVEMEAASLTSSNPIQSVSTKRKLIRTVDLNVETTNFDQLISDIGQNVANAGGYIEQSDISGSSLSSGAGRRYAHFTARVPADKLDGFITQVSQQGNITNKSEYTQDVTLQYTDIESRKKSLTIEQERLWALLEKADTLESVIALEERLSEIRYQLEGFESQLRTYDNQVDYSTVSIYVNEVQVLTPTTPDTISDRIGKGFRRNLEAVSRTSINFIVWFLSSLPTLLIFALLLLILAFIGRKLNLTPGSKLSKHTKRIKNTRISSETSTHSTQSDLSESSASDDNTRR